MVDRYKVNKSDLSDLESNLRIAKNSAEFQSAITRWFRHYDPIRNIDRGSTKYPNRITPDTVLLLLAILEEQNLVAQKAIESAIPLTGIPGAELEQLRIDTERLKKRLEYYKGQTLNIPMGLRSVILDPTSPPLDSWGKRVALPLFFGIFPSEEIFEEQGIAGAQTLPDVPKALIYAQTAGVSREAQDNAIYLLSNELQSVAKNLASQSYLPLAVLVGVGALFLAKGYGK